MPFKLGEIDGSADGAVLFYGALRGLQRDPYRDRERSISITEIGPCGRVIRFRMEVGRSGVDSTIYDRDGQTEVFRRNEHHVEAGRLRGLLVLPTHSTVGILISEVHGRSGGKNLLAAALKKILRDRKGLVANFESVVDDKALQKYLEEAEYDSITLRRESLPADVADAVDYPQSEENAGKLELKITPGRGKGKFRREVIERLRGDDTARRRLLHVGEMDFDELSVGVKFGDRQTTLTITADRIPSFVYDLPGRSLPTDDVFYREALANVEDMARTVGIPVGTSWQTGDWSSEALAAILPVPWEAGINETARNRA